MAVRGYVERSRTAATAVPAAADKGAVAALVHLRLVCALLGGLGESEGEVERKARRYALLIHAADGELLRGVQRRRHRSA
jgi:hypothetical protein